MKTISTSFVALLMGLSLQAQVFYNDGATIIIDTNATLRVHGDIMNKAGTFNNKGTLTVTGNITNNTSSTTPIAGTLRLAGTTLQALTGTAPLAAKNLMMNNAAGVTLFTPLRIEGEVTFASGIINATSSNNPVVFSANGSVSGVPTNASHVNGYVVKEGTGTFTYPLGNATAYQPIGVNLTDNSGGLKALYVAADAGTAPFGTGGTEATLLTQYNPNEYWNVEPVGTATGTVTVYYDDYQNTPISTNTNDLRVAHKTGGMWLNEGRVTGSGGNNIAGVITSNAVSTWSPFTFGAITPVILPLQWLSVSGTVSTQKTASLTWNVAETNVQHYTIEKSTDGRTFTAIGSVASKGNGTNSYAFGEGAVLSGTAYYRILQTDLNGRTSFSAIIKLSALNSEGITVYPNPVKNVAQVSVPAGLLNTQAALYNAAGQKLKAILIQSQAFILNLNEYKSGTYLLLFSNGTTARIIKQ